MRYLCLYAILLFMAACGKKTKTQLASFLNTSNLPTEKFVVTTSKGATFTTINGTTINIPAASIKAATDTVTLNWKEAVSVQQMVLGGLNTTTADGKPLSSAGMFYLDAASDKTAQIVKPIQINLPTTAVNDSMKLFAAKEVEGKLQWEKPIPFRVKKTYGSYPDGKALFSANCASCHLIDKNTTGPALGNMGRRRSMSYLIKFTNNWEEAVASGDCQAIKIQNFSTARMNKFNFTPEEIKAIYDYCDEASDSEVPSYKFDDYYIKATQDSCEAFNKQKLQLSKLRAERAKYSETPFVTINELDIPIAPIVGDTNNFAIDTLPNLITTVEPASAYYDVSINKFGWHNIDILTTEMPNIKEVEVTVPIQATYEDYLKVMLIVPESKIMLEAQLLNGNYVFGVTDAKLNLRTNERCYILAIGEKNDKLVYSLQAFVPQEKNNINLNVQTTTPASFNETIRRLGWTGLDIKAAESKAAGKARELDYELKKIESLKPKVGCECESKPNPATANQTSYGLPIGNIISFDDY